ncbi:MAG: hypothetical protein ACTS7D_01700 [Candidatus Hodgkinia cicadicola]
MTSGNETRKRPTDVIKSIGSPAATVRGRTTFGRLKARPEHYFVASRDRRSPLSFSSINLRARRSFRFSLRARANLLSPLGSGKKENGERIRKLWTEIYLEWAALLRHNRREMLNWKAAERFERFNRRKC